MHETLKESGLIELDGGLTRVQTLSGSLQRESMAVGTAY